MSFEFAAITYRTLRDRIGAEEPQIDEQTLADTMRATHSLSFHTISLIGCMCVSHNYRVF